MNNDILLGFDVGERRIGVARATVHARIASPLTTLIRTDTENIFEMIKRLVEQEHAGMIVIGLPRSMDGNDTDQTRKIREFADTLRQQLQSTVKLQDEAVTSIEAEAALRLRGKPYDKADIDAEAAALILQDYLDEQERQV